MLVQRTIGHGGKSMGVQEERNVVASRGWTQRASASWHGDFIFSPLSEGFNTPRFQQLIIAPGFEGRALLHPTVVSGRNRTTGLRPVDDL